MNLPTLNEAIASIASRVKDIDTLQSHLLDVCEGRLPPRLQASTSVLAAHTLAVILQHIKNHPEYAKEEEESPSVPTEEELLGLTEEPDGNSSEV